MLFASGVKLARARICASGTGKMHQIDALVPDLCLSSAGSGIHKYHVWVACPLCSEKLLNDVYGYWAAKRKRWGKPILRRLQAPTIASDTNPYNTFRCMAACVVECCAAMHQAQCWCRPPQRPCSTTLVHCT